jgi:hypothetical protein
MVRNTEAVMAKYMLCVIAFLALTVSVKDSNAASLDTEVDGFELLAQPHIPNPYPNRQCTAAQQSFCDSEARRLCGAATGGCERNIRGVPHCFVPCGPVPVPVPPGVASDVSGAIN